MLRTRRSFLKRSGLVAASALAAPHIARSSDSIASRPGQKPRRIIMLVSDGMSTGTFTAANHLSILTRNRPTTWMRLLHQPGTVQGMMDMRTLNSIVPDSAAAGSKWGSGSHIVNGAVNQFADGTDLRTLYEILGDAGWQRGLVTTTEMTHATPASFAANAGTRNMAETIAEQYLERRIEVLLGGGQQHFDPARRQDKRDLFGDYQKEGYAVLRTADELRRAPAAKRWLGVFTPTHMPFLIDHLDDPEHRRTVPPLADMARRALEKLEQSDRFILMVEGGRIDQACHNCDIAAALREQLAFDEAIDVALEFQRRDPETLVVITTDHGTGNPGVNATGGAYARSSPLFRNVAEMKCSVAELFRRLGSAPSVAHVQSVLREAAGYETPNDKAELLALALARKGRAMYDHMSSAIGQIGQLLANHFAVGWVGSTHTADYVLTTALGPGAEQFRGFINGTDVFDTYLAFAGVDFRNPQQQITDGFGLETANVENTTEYWQQVA